MCNRYFLEIQPEELFETLDVSTGFYGEIRGEYFPGKPVPVLRHTGGQRELVRMSWGFPPFKGSKPINNTRSESAARSPFWKRHLENRCVFPITTACEWQHRIDPQSGEVRKLPHAIRFRDGRLAVVAGIYMHDHGREYASMMTCRANALWSTIHNANPDDPRMVCFLTEAQQVRDWLDPTLPYTAVAKMLRPLPDASDLLIAEPRKATGRSPRAHENPDDQMDTQGLFGQDA